MHHHISTHNYTHLYIPIHTYTHLYTPIHTYTHSYEIHPCFPLPPPITSYFPYLLFTYYTFLTLHYIPYVPLNHLSSLSLISSLSLLPPYLPLYGVIILTPYSICNFPNILYLTYIHHPTFLLNIHSSLQFYIYTLPVIKRTRRLWGRRQLFPWQRRSRQQKISDASMPAIVAGHGGNGGLGDTRRSHGPGSHTSVHRSELDVSSDDCDTHFEQYLYIYIYIYI